MGSKYRDRGLCSYGPHEPLKGRPFCEKHLMMHRASNRRKTRMNKQKCIDGYGGKCTCCGENTFEFLTLDHINNDGNIQRKEMFGINSGSGSQRLYVWAIRNNFPDTLQLLCSNCNMAKSWYKQCPHKEVNIAKSTRNS